MPTELHQETWKPVVGYEGIYEVSDYGNVRRIDGHIRSRGRDHMLGTPGYWGYPYVMLYKNGSKIRIAIHRLVLFAFDGPCPDGFQCAHLDGNPKNANRSNLKWVSVKENASHKVAHGTLLHGEAHYNRKLSNADIPQIFSLRKSGHLIREIAAHFHVSQGAIKHVLYRDSWVRALPDQEPVKAA